MIKKIYSTRLLIFTFTEFYNFLWIELRTHTLNVSLNFDLPPSFRLIGKVDGQFISGRNSGTTDSHKQKCMDSIYLVHTDQAAMLQTPECLRVLHFLVCKVDQTNYLLMTHFKSYLATSKWTSFPVFLLLCESSKKFKEPFLIKLIHWKSKQTDRNC